MRAYKYRIYPSNKQKIRLLNQFKICKNIYNTLLCENKELMTTKKFDFDSLVKDIKTTCPSYYYQAHSQVLQNVSDRLHKAFDNFFRRLEEKKSGKKIKAGFPRFKSRIKSITYPQSGFKFLNERRLKLSKIGSIPIVLHRTPRGKIKTLTIKQNKAGQWFAFFCCELPDVIIKHPSIEKIGIDVNSRDNFCFLSNGESVDNPKFLVKSEKRLKLIQRRLSRKKKGSANRRKARFKVARLHNKIANQRSDFHHKLSRNLTLRYSIIAVEDLNIKSMINSSYNAKFINDASWNSFIQMLSYKAVISGGQLVKNPKTKGSSHRCSKCGFYVEDMPLSRKVFKCPNCLNVCHRDFNASNNHLKDTVGLTGIPTPVDDCVRPPLLKATVVEAGTKCHCG